MEATRSRSQSPFSKCKTKGQVSDSGENGDDCNDQIKNRKRNQKSKQKIQDLEKNGNGAAKNDTMEFLNQIEDGSSAEQFNEVTNGNETENGNILCSENEDNVENNNFNNDHDDKVHFDTSIELTNEVEPLSVAEAKKNEDLKEKNQENHNCKTLNEVQPRTDNVDIETEVSNNLLEKEPENLEDKVNSNNLPQVNNVSITCTNGDETTNGSSIQDSDNEVNGSHDNSVYEDANISDENFIQASFDTSTNKDTSFSDKLSNFIGKWSSLSPTQNQRQDEPKVYLHPYLSKVSGRPGIKEKSNSGYITNGKDIETPKTFQIGLDDSFRVKSDPPRLNQKEAQENSVLRKYKGKRCLNTYDESEDGEGTSYVNSKRRKLDDNTSKPGFLGSILLSPFKKRPLNVDEPSKLTTPQSKISRFLSPFWFWKKATTVEQDPK